MSLVLALVYDVISIMKQIGVKSIYSMYLQLKSSI